MSQQICPNRVKDQQKDCVCISLVYFFKLKFCLSQLIRKLSPHHTESPCMLECGRPLLREMALFAL